MVKRTTVACAMSLMAAAVLGACSFAPVYQAPALPVVTTFKEASGVWRPAQAATQLPHGAWWTIYRDDALDGWERAVDRANPQVAAAVARYDEASSDLDQARAGLLPTLSLDADSEQNRQSDYRPLRGSTQPDIYGSHTVSLGASYELDLWGRVRNEVREGRAQQQANADDLAAVKLSLEAQLAQAYFTLRGLDREGAALEDTAQADRRALALTLSRYDGGIASQLDVLRARTQVSLVAAQSATVAQARARAEHAMAALLGVPASTFSVTPVASMDTVPAIPAILPSTLLQRRPDVAAAERRVVAANYAIGVARAAWFPDISLGLAGGYQSDATSNWLSAPASFWSLGPALAVDLFDGGRRAAIDKRARAQFDERSADYRTAALRAFQETEDRLADARELGVRARNEADALASARAALALATGRYRDGAVSYLDVVTAQTTALDTERAAVQTQTDQLIASVGLVEAIGGGWTGDSGKS